MVKKFEGRHDLSGMEFFGEQENLERELRLDDLIICHCDGTANQVLKCLQNQIDLGKSKEIFEFSRSDERWPFNCLRDGMRICAERGYEKILNYIKKNKKV